MTQSIKDMAEQLAEEEVRRLNPRLVPPAAWAAVSRLVAGILEIAGQARLAEREACDGVLADMQQDSHAYLRGIADALRLVEHRMFAPGAGDGPGARETETAEAARILLRTIAQQLCAHLPVRLPGTVDTCVRAGSVEITCSGPGTERVLLDGRPVAFRAASVRVAVGAAPEVTLDIVPLASRPANKGKFRPTPRGDLT